MLPCLVALAIGTVWLRLTIVKTSYAIDQANREIRNLELEHEQVDLRVTALRSPRRLEQLARTRFGLAPPQSDRIVHLREPVSEPVEDRVISSLAAPQRTEPAQ